MAAREIIGSKRLQLTIQRLCYQLLETHDDFSESCLIGIQPRGVYLSDRIYKRLTHILGYKDIRYGRLDVTFYRDDFRKRKEPIIPESTEIDFSIEDQNVVLIDDVLFTGRTVRAALDALLDFGRPKDVELLTLIDRRFSRHVPIQPKYIGERVDSVAAERVKVEWEQLQGEDRVILLAEENNTS